MIEIALSRPKSASFRMHCLVIRMFSACMSLWVILLLLMKKRPSHICFKTFLISPRLNFTLMLLSKPAKSYSQKSNKIESGLVPTVLSADHNEVDDVLKVEQLEDPDHPESIDKEAFLLIFDQNFHNLALKTFPKGPLSNLSNLLILVYPGAVGELILLTVPIPLLGHLCNAWLLCYYAGGGPWPLP